jgi:phosphoglycerate dehydrogenase-like enzyme
MNTLPRIAVIDDTQDLARTSADWSPLVGRAEVVFMATPFADEDDAARQLEPFDVIVPMRERTAFPASLVRRLPNLKLFAMTGLRAGTFDIPSFTAAGIVVSNTGIDTTAATSELAFALVMACARTIPLADRVMREGGWHEGVPVGTVLAGKRLGILGLGKLGGKVAGFARAFDMEVVAWSPNLDEARAKAGGATLVGKRELFETSDVVSIHIVMSDRTRGIVGAEELAAMKDGAILVNTSRGPLVDEAALVAELTSGRIRAGLDVFDREPLQSDHPLRRLPNVVLTPHLGYGAAHVFRQFYSESVENILAWLDGKPIRVLNAEVRSATS